MVVVKVVVVVVAPPGENDTELGSKRDRKTGDEVETMPVVVLGRFWVVFACISEVPGGFWEVFGFEFATALRGCQSGRLITPDS